MLILVADFISIVMNIEDLHVGLPKYLPAEISDKLQFFLRSRADQQMRFVIFLGQQIKFDTLKKAFRLAIYAEPIFSYFYKEHKNWVYWQKQNEIDDSLIIDLLTINDDLEGEINRFLTLEISPFSFPIVRARVIRNGQKDTICLNMNHTPTDGAGLKEFVRKWASIYGNLLINPEYPVNSNIQGDRSIKQVTNYFGFIQKISFLRRGLKPRKEVLTWSFDWDKSDSNNEKHIIKTKITNETFNKIKVYGKINNATFNDIVLAAFVRSFETTNKVNENAAKPIIIPVDLRKYCKPSHNTAICSLTSSLICNIGNEIGKSFNDTLAKVREEMNLKKQSHAEMNMITLSIFLSRIMPYHKLKEQFMYRKMRPIPLVTNVGIINPEDIDFSGIPVEDAYIIGAITLKDNFCMGYSTFQNESTCSIGFTGGELQQQKVVNFLNRFIAELENIPSVEIKN